MALKTHNNFHNSLVNILLINIDGERIFKSRIWMNWIYTFREKSNGGRKFIEAANPFLKSVPILLNNDRYNSGKFWQQSESLNLQKLEASGTFSPPLYFTLYGDYWKNSISGPHSFNWEKYENISFIHYLRLRNFRILSIIDPRAIFCAFLCKTFMYILTVWCF